MLFHPPTCLQGAYRAVSGQPLRDGQRTEIKRGGPSHTDDVVCCVVTVCCTGVILLQWTGATFGREWSICSESAETQLTLVSHIVRTLTLTRPALFNPLNYMTQGSP